MGKTFKIGNTHISFRTARMTAFETIVAPINSLKIITSEDDNCFESQWCNDYPISRETYNQIMNIIEETT